MTDTQQEKSKNLIPSSFSQAFLAGGIASGLSIAFGTPIEYAPRIFLAGSCFSLYLSWQDSRHLTAPRKKSKGRSIPFNSYKGQKKIYPDSLEFSILSNQSFVNRLIYGKQTREIEIVDRPKILNEAVFYSHYGGQRIELRGGHVKLFLANAWKNRAYGKGLSRRRWDRERSQRPYWYKELPTVWYFGMSMLLWDAQRKLNIQIVVKTGHQWYALAIEPKELYHCLKWYNYEINK